MPHHLDAERRAHFFTWFNLAPAGAPVPIAGAGAWHCFRPTGDAFRALVEVDVLADAAGAIDAACLGLERSFVDDRRNSPFARDIAKSFLAWAIADPSSRMRALIANIADFGAGGAVLMRGPGPPPPPPDTTGAYDVFLGRSGKARVGPEAVALTNVAGPMPRGRLFDARPAATAGPGGPGWLRIDVRLAPEREMSVFGRLGRWASGRLRRASRAG